MVLCPGASGWCVVNGFVSRCQRVVCGKWFCVQVLVGGVW